VIFDCLQRKKATAYLKVNSTHNDDLQSRQLKRYLILCLRLCMRCNRKVNLNLHNCSKSVNNNTRWQPAIFVYIICLRSVCGRSTT